MGSGQHICVTCDDTIKVPYAPFMAGVATGIIAAAAAAMCGVVIIAYATKRKLQKFSSSDTRNDSPVTLNISADDLHFQALRKYRKGRIRKVPPGLLPYIDLDKELTEEDMYKYRPGTYFLRRNEERDGWYMVLLDHVDRTSRKIFGLETTYFGEVDSIRLMKERLHTAHKRRRGKSVYICPLWKLHTNQGAWFEYIEPPPPVATDIDADELLFGAFSRQSPRGKLHPPINFGTQDDDLPDMQDFPMRHQLVRIHEDDEQPLVQKVRDLPKGSYIVTRFNNGLIAISKIIGPSTCDQMVDMVQVLWEKERNVKFLMDALDQVFDDDRYMISARMGNVEEAYMLDLGPPVATDINVEELLFNTLPPMNCVDWTEETDWEHHLCITAKSYIDYIPILFDDIEPVRLIPPDPNRFENGTYIDSPDGRWRYANLTLPKGQTLSIYEEYQEGKVQFDDDVLIPALYERSRSAWNTGFNPSPWMSFTPNELITLQPGTDIAYGTVVIAGLGLGHQLMAVARKKDVQRIILLEYNRVLADWLLPRIRELLGGDADKLTDVIIGDAYDTIKGIEADVALIDIFPGWGDIRSEMNRFKSIVGSNIEYVWGWGIMGEQCEICGNVVLNDNLYDRHQCSTCGCVICEDCEEMCECGERLCYYCYDEHSGLCEVCYEDQDEDDDDDW